MKQRDVIVLPEAENDLAEIHEYVKAKAGREIANRYVDRIGALLHGLSQASERGTLRSEVRAGRASSGLSGGSQWPSLSMTGR